MSVAAYIAVAIVSPLTLFMLFGKPLLLWVSSARLHRRLRSAAAVEETARPF